MRRLLRPGLRRYIRDDLDELAGTPACSHSCWICKGGIKFVVLQIFLVGETCLNLSITSAAVPQLGCGRLQKRKPIRSDNADVAVSRKVSSRSMHAIANKLTALRVTSTVLGSLHDSLLRNGVAAKLFRANMSSRDGAGSYLSPDLPVPRLDGALVGEAKLA